MKEHIDTSQEKLLCFSYYCPPVESGWLGVKMRGGGGGATADPETAATSKNTNLILLFVLSPHFDISSHLLPNIQTPSWFNCKYTICAVRVCFPPRRKQNVPSFCYWWRCSGWPKPSLCPSPPCFPPSCSPCLESWSHQMWVSLSVSQVSLWMKEITFKSSHGPKKINANDYPC